MLDLTFQRIGERVAVYPEGRRRVRPVPITRDGLGDSLVSPRPVRRVQATRSPSTPATAASNAATAASFEVAVGGTRWVNSWPPATSRVGRREQPGVQR